jgi:hypothetical protein
LKKTLSMLTLTTVAFNLSGGCAVDSSEVLEVDVTEQALYCGAGSADGPGAPLVSNAQCTVRGTTERVDVTVKRVCRKLSVGSVSGKLPGVSAKPTTFNMSVKLPVENLPNSATDKSTRVGLIISAPNEIHYADVGVPGQVSGSTTWSAQNGKVSLINLSFSGKTSNFHDNGGADGSGPLFPQQVNVDLIGCKPIAR